MLNFLPEVDRHNIWTQLKKKAEPKSCLLEDFPNKITYSVSSLTMANYINFFPFLPSRDFGV
jgi:hypothetical protein